METEPKMKSSRCDQAWSHTGIISINDVPLKAAIAFTNKTEFLEIPLSIPLVKDNNEMNVTVADRRRPRCWSSSGAGLATRDLDP